MHIPDGMLTTPVWAGLTAVSAGALGIALRRANRDLDEKRVPLLGVTAAFVFAAQMVNFPVAAGTSAHFVGSALVAIVLGPWAGMVVMAAVLIIQCFLFGDGGLTALGANFFNMGFLGAASAACVHRAAVRLFGPQRGFMAGAFAAAWVASTLPAVACAVELGLSDALPMRAAVATMGVLHAVTGVVEGLITVAALGFLRRVRPDLLAREIPTP